ncbi:polysaccharide lyase [Rubrivivax sp. RP6-9]|uniref:polysaccharide lyase n=1 Tax=Rubrivivax sp. RP6-9 TaxID=3415750 RepID=UPI003CC6D9EB
MRQVRTHWKSFGRRAAAVLLACWLLPAAGTGAFAFRDAPDGISCRFFDAALGLQWSGGTAIWVDAVGRVGGGKAYDTQRLAAANSPLALRWNVLLLVRGWVSGSLPNDGVLLAPTQVGAGGADFHAREADDVGQRPALRVRYGDGGVQLLSAQADAHLDCSTAAGLGERKSLHIGPGSAGVLRFDVSRLRKGPQQAIVAAELILFRDTSVGVWSDGSLAAYRLATPWNETFDAPERGIAAAYSGDRGIEMDPAVLWADSFANGRMKDGWNKAQMVRAKVRPPVAAPTTEGGVLALPSLEVTIPRAEHLGLDLRYHLPRLADGNGRSEAYFRYYIRLGSEWASSPDAGKLPGFAGTYDRAGWGGRGWNGMQGWSARGSFGKGATPDHPAHGLLPLGSYVYHSKTESAYGDILVWGGAGGAGLVPPNRWVCVEQHIRLNTPGKGDGMLRAWIDGKPVFLRRGLRFRDTPQIAIENVWFNVYMGGKQAALRDMSVNIAHVVVATAYIGPLAP